MKIEEKTQSDTRFFVNIMLKTSYFSKEINGLFLALRTKTTLAIKKIYDVVNNV